MRLLRKTSVYLPTLPMLLVLLGLLALAGTLAFRNAGVYLSPTQPTGSGTLLIEGWVDRKSFAQAVATYRNGRYTRLVTTGGPYFLDCDRDDAGYAAQVATLARDSGLGDGELAVIRVSNTRSDRTRTAAVATARWLQAQPGLQSSLDVYSEGPHARRSWLVYRRELEPLGMRVGIIAAPPDWSTATWWRQSEGVKAVVSEAAGWLWETCCSGAAAKQARI
jgi:hypothetical protein